ncbi:hypothetical protein AKO1_001887 [Acrasis kona]|uniref:Uncharacterized protein n=1 Tax=Acrasis kona TaxID=1008807 RepID=A0AAW2ZBW2_9EUKA
MRFSFMMGRNFSMSFRSSGGFSQGKNIFTTCFKSERAAFATAIGTGVNQLSRSNLSQISKISVTGTNASSAFDALIVAEDDDG